MVPEPGEAPEIMACATCGRVLNHHPVSGYQHLLGDKAGQGHAPVPVPASEALVIGRCDFCHVDFPGWVIPARDFQVLPGHASRGDWAACDTCAHLIETDQWSRLVTRAVDGWKSRNGVEMPTLVAGSLPRLYRLLRKNITGAAKPNPNAFGDHVPDGLRSGDFGRGSKTDPAT